MNSFHQVNGYALAAFLIVVLVLTYLGRNGGDDQGTFA